MLPMRLAATDADAAPRALPPGRDALIQRLSIYTRIARRAGGKTMMSPPMAISVLSGK